MDDLARTEELPVPQPTRAARPFGLPGTLVQRWNALAITACGATVLVLGHRHRWTNDDALIYTRAVRQILAGNGPVFNVGERAESSTGTLWQWLLAAGGAVPGITDPLRLAVALGLVLTVAGYLLALDGTRRLIRLHRPSGALLPFGVLLLLPLCATWDYATSGLETGLSFAWLGGSWWLLVRARAGLDDTAVRRRPPLALTAFVFGLAPLVRPDLAPAGLLFLAALWLMRRPAGPSPDPSAAGRGRTARTALGWICAAGALPVGYEIFRAGYYGVLVPLPALAKEATGTQWGYGWDYLLNTLLPYALWIPLTLVAAHVFHTVRTARAARTAGPARSAHPARRTGAAGEAGATGYPSTAGEAGAALGLPAAAGRRGPRDAARHADAVLIAAPVAAGLLSAFFVVKIGGDFMHGRMVLPALFLLLLPLFLIPYGRAGALLTVAVTVWGAVCLALLRPPLDMPGRRIVYDSHTVYARSLGAHPVTQSAHTERPRPFTSAVRRTLHDGTRGLVLRLPNDKGYPVLPLAPHVPGPAAGAEARLGNAGAVLPLDARAVDLLGLANPLGAHTLPTHDRKAGHEKPLDRAWVLADLTAPGTPVPYGVDPRRVAAARHALTCGPLPELLASVREPMSPGRFVDNLTGAWERTRLRIPADPLEAERALCR